MSDTDNAQEPSSAPRITNSFVFDDAAYKEIAIHSDSYVIFYLIRFYSKVLIGLSLFASPMATVAFLSYIGFFGEGTGGEWWLLAFSLLWVFSFILGVTGLTHFSKKILSYKAQAHSIDQKFVTLKEGKGLLFAFHLDEVGKPIATAKEANQRSRDFRKKLKQDPTYGKGKPYEVEFNATITDEGIYIGKSQTPFITDFQAQIWEEVESKNYYALTRNDRVDVVFKKAAFKGASRNQVKAFIKAKRKGKQVTLSDYVNNKKYY